MRESTRRKCLHDVGIGIGTAAVAGSSPVVSRTADFALSRRSVSRSQSATILTPATFSMFFRS